MILMVNFVFFVLDVESANYVMREIRLNNGVVDR